MLWRSAYVPRILRSVPLPNGSDQPRVCVGGFDLKALGEIGIWQRLLDGTDAANRYRIQLFGDGATFPPRLVRAVIPPSQRDRFEIVEAATREWKELVAPDRPERSFAAVIREGKADLLVIGAPTEEVWDEFQAVMSSTLKTS